MQVEGKGPVADESLFVTLKELMEHMLECKRVWSHDRCGEVAAHEGREFPKSFQNAILAANSLTVCRLHCQPLLPS